MTNDLSGGEKQSKVSGYGAFHHCCCNHSEHPASEDSALDISRRDFLTGLTVAAGLSAWAMSPSKALGFFDKTTGEKIPQIGQALKVKPVLVYALWERKEAQSWRHWGGLHSQQDLNAEAERIRQELKNLAAKADFGLEIMPLSLVKDNKEADGIKNCDCDMFLVYAESYGQGALEVFAAAGKPNVAFARHKSGPMYHGYECLHHRFLRGSTDDPKVEEMDYWDVVIDDYDEILWRLRALYGLRNTLGTKIVTIGGAGGWGRMGAKYAPAAARELWKMDIIDVDYKDIEPRIKKLLDDPQAVIEAERLADEYLARKGNSLHTVKKSLVNSFLLTRTFKELMAENAAPAMTIQGCMNVIMPVSKTSACIPLSLINDEGLMAFCESDFVTIPAGVLLRHISGRPVFLNDPTYPHKAVTTLAHCTAPSKMNGRTRDPVKVVTHFESDYGASPKVEFKKGQTITGIVPAFGCDRWVGFTGRIIDHPFYDICRSQMDIEIDGDWKRLVEKTVGFHWMICYGDYLKEVGYALKKIGVKWEDVSTPQA